MNREFDQEAFGLLDARLIYRPPSDQWEVAVFGLNLTDEFDRLDPIDAESRTVRVGPGVIAGDLDRALRHSRFFFPPLPSSADRCTLGGMIANNAAGARSFGYGAVRDWVEELEVVWVDGERTCLATGGALPPRLQALHAQEAEHLGVPIRGWPCLAKNSSGYQLDRFLEDRDGVQLLD